MAALSHFLLHPLPRSIPGLSMESPQPSPTTRKSPLSLSPASQVTLGPAGQSLSPLLSPVLSHVGGARTDNEEQPKHKVGTSPADNLLLVGLVCREAGAGRAGSAWGVLAPPVKSVLKATCQLGYLSYLCTKAGSLIHLTALPGTCGFRVGVKGNG